MADIGREAIQLAAETGCAVYTARRYLLGHKVRKSTAYALEQAAMKIAARKAAEGSHGNGESAEDTATANETLVADGTDG